MSARFYVPGIREPGQEASIRGDELHHLRNVLRLTAGACVELFDGAGRAFSGRIVSVDPRCARIRVEGERAGETESPLCLTLWVALLKAEKLEWVIQKATELGVTAVQPVCTLRADLKLSESQAEKRLARWRRIALEACKQCGRNRIPRVETPLPLPELLSRSGRGRGVYLDPQAPPNPERLSRLAGETRIELAVGPEGGWSPEEVSSLKRADFTALRLGPRILRGETAAIVATALVQFLAGDLSGAGRPAPSR